MRKQYLTSTIFFTVLKLYNRRRIHCPLSEQTKPLKPATSRFPLEATENLLKLWGHDVYFPNTPIFFTQT